MSFNTKITIICLLCLICAPLGFVWYYKKTHQPIKREPIAPRQEINITIIPGWNLRQIAADWQKKGLIKSEDALYALLGKPAYNYKANKQLAPNLNLVDAAGQNLYPLLADKPAGISYEGYLMPDTYRVYADAKVDDLLAKIFSNLENKITPQMRADIQEQGKSFFDILTMASVIEKEAPTADMPQVADIFWRRYQKNWALQSCATVNYVTGKYDPGVSSQDKEVNSLFNTYKYPGLPLGPISNPGLNAIKAAIYPQKNDYWYFMTGSDGAMHYARTLEEHNYNVHHYLK